MVAQDNRSIMHPVHIVQGVSNAHCAYRSKAQRFNCINDGVATDAGCGTGAMLKLLAKDVPGKEFYGIDLSEKMIEVAKENGGNIHFQQGDCETLPYPDESFDVVTCSMSFHHYPHVEKFFLNVGRVLKPGGRLILRDMTSRSAFILWIINNIELPLANLVGKGDVHCYSRAEVKELCERSGLQLENFEVRRGMRMHAVIRK